ncbi:glucoamylase family protein [Brevundimonas sp. Root1279]|uniref:glucoamylase family protein n=1 Tax=Brevundimonas sp. Root1279 TaxID=1736443 RepID=UPI000700C52F|nr:glucoamylase family protein [Brevundimonas sp. Root1279]KQW84021.1 Tat pathway signal protein [Brevundimonas sp. Root1279]
MDRRHFLMGSTVAGAAALGLAGCAGSGSPWTVPTPLDPEVEELQRRTFNWFTHVTNRSNGLTPDRWPTPSFSSVAAVGFALTCWPVGVERGWMTREEARERTLTTVRFFHDAPQGPEPTGNAGYKGFFYHFLDMQTGHRFGRTELSTVDTTLLLGGMLFAAQWFDGDHPEEAEIRRLTQAVYERVEWDWVVIRPNRISMGWHPETGFIPADWHVYNEGMLVLMLAMGSPTHPVPAAVWQEWTSVYDQSWTDKWGPAHLHFPPMFGHQYSHMYIDFRGIQDAWMRAKQAEIPGFDYFQNSVRAVAAQRKYAIDNTMGWAGYSADVWGLTACDGPGDFKEVIGGRERQFFSYSARGPGDRDDGTIAPTAAMGSMPFAPTEVTACLKAMKAQYGHGIYTEFGFLDSFNPTLEATQRTLQHGKLAPGVGWVDGDYLGIDQGPIVIQIENHRSDIVWKYMRREPNLLRGLKAAGFSGGWLNRA